MTARPQTGEHQPPARIWQHSKPVMKKTNQTSVLNASVLFVVSIVRNHPGDDKRDASVDREAHAWRHSGAAETGRGGQPAGLAGRHTGKMTHGGNFCLCLQSFIFDNL